MRKRRAVKRDVLPDPIYNSKVITKLINTIMLDGKKGIAQTILYEAFDLVKERTGSEPMEVFDKAMENITPQVEVKSRRVGIILGVRSVRDNEDLNVFIKSTR